MNSDYYQLVQPYYHANKIPSGNVGASPVGYNMYSYALNPMSSDPSGSTNYGKLTNVALRLATNTSNDFKRQIPLMFLCFSYFLENFAVSVFQKNSDSRV